MKHLLVLVSLLSSLSALAHGHSTKLKYCSWESDIVKARINFKLVVLDDVGHDLGGEVYVVTANYNHLGHEFSDEDIPAIVTESNNKIKVSFPTISVENELEENQSITIDTSKQLDKTDSDVTYSAVLSSLYFGDTVEEQVTCTLSL
jgi:hypothetical protein